VLKESDMAKGKFTTHKQTILRSGKTGRFVSTKAAKAKTTKKETVTIKHKR
jgi:hypothetical protein